VVGKQVKITSDQLALQDGSGVVGFSSPSAQRVSIGVYSNAGVKLSGLLSQGGAPLAGLPVSVSAEPFGTSTFTNLATVTTSTTGAYSTTTKPKKQTVYQASAAGVTAPPTVTVKVEAENESITSKSTLTKLVPVLGEGTLDYAAIVEGERRLENFYQEKGYFFARVRPKCSVEPAFKEEEASVITNNTEFLCSALGGAELMNRKVDIVYEADVNRRYNLKDIRLTGTSQFTIEDILPALESQESKGTARLS